MFMKTQSRNSTVTQNEQFTKYFQANRDECQEMWVTIMLI